MAFFGLRFSLRRLIKRSRAPNRAIEKSRKSPLSFPLPFHAAFVPPVRAIKRTRRRSKARSGGEGKRERKSRHLSSYFPRGRLFEPEQGFPETFSKAGAWCEARFFSAMLGRSNKVGPSLLRGVEIPFFLLSFFHYPKGGLRKRQGKKRTGGKRAVVTFG